MKYLQPLFPFLLGGLLLFFSPSFHPLFVVNTVAQLLLFGLVVCWPIWKTGRLAYVDIGWPMGLAVIGCLNLYFGEGYIWRVRTVSFIYLFIGLRRGLGALQLWRKGYMKKEFHRLHGQM